MGVKININQAAIRQKIENAKDKAIFDVTSEILGDSQEYVKHAEGQLESSGYEHSELGKGIIRWVAPYARRQYWEIKTAHKDFNPKATWRWFEAAKRDNLEKWKKNFAKHFKEKL